MSKKKRKTKNPQSYEYLNFSINIEDGIEMWLGVAVIIQIIKTNLIQHHAKKN
jgi:hypothetical protein